DVFFFFSSRRRHTRSYGDWSSDVCSSDLLPLTSKKEKVEAGAEGFAVEVDEEIVVPREDDIVIPDKLSYIVVIIDELADLMLVEIGRASCRKSADAGTRRGTKKKTHKSCT